MSSLAANSTANWFITSKQHNELVHYQQTAQRIGSLPANSTASCTYLLTETATKCYVSFYSPSEGVVIYSKYMELKLIFVDNI